METQSNIYKKLATFEKPSIVKDESGYNYKYAGLDQLQEKLKDPLVKAWLHYFHRTDNWKVITRVYCIDTPESFIESSIEIWECRSETIEKKWDKTVTEIASHDPQMQWSSITYYRRYNLLQIFDIEIDDDDWKSGSPKAKAKVETKTTTTEKWEIHKCTKCSKESEAKVFEWKYWLCFKCEHCDWFSKPNPIPESQKEYLVGYE
jgi:hypothetical protein